MSDDKKLIGKTIVWAKINGFGVELRFSDGSNFDYSSSDGGYSCWEIIDNTKQAEVSEDYKLKPCPFCGGEAEIWKSRPFEIGKIIECQKCGVRVAIPWAMANTQATEAWNRRVERSEDEH